MTKSAHPDFSNLTLTVTTFPQFYRYLHQLRFPVPVSQVLELRYLLNHATDAFHAPPRTRDYRQFLEALGTAIDSFGTGLRAHHRQRLLKLLTLLRQLHLDHSLASRDQELALRSSMAHNREDRGRCVRFIVLWSVATVASLLTWAYLPEPPVALKLGALACAVLTLHCTRRLPRLDVSHETLRRELNGVLRVRIATLDWKLLIHKLSLVLGFKQAHGVEVFHSDEETRGGTRPRRRH